MVARLEMSGKVEEISGQMDQLQRMIQLVANNSSSNSAAVADGSGRGARERQMQNLSLAMTSRCGGGQAREGNGSSVAGHRKAPGSPSTTCRRCWGTCWR